jgi:membrane protein YqaA with SNARE-associated domain
MKALYLWAREQARQPAAPYVLGLCMCLEGIVIIPSSTLFTLCCLAQPHAAGLLIFIALTSSLFAAFISYIIGYGFWHIVQELLFSYVIQKTTFIQAVSLYQRYAWTAAISGSFLPIPFNALTISAGICQLPLVPFLGGILIGRLVRFSAIALITYIFGDMIHFLLDRYFYSMSMLGILVMILCWYCFPT